MIDDIKRQNDRHHFLTEFIRKNGLPVWNKVVANVPIAGNNHLNNQTGIGGRLNDTNSIEIFFIPLRAADNSVKTYIACVKDSGKYKYDVYRRNILTYLDTISTPVKKFRNTMLSVFGFFEKSINNQDTIFVAGQYQSGIKEVSISFDSTWQNGSRTTAAKITDGGSIVQICYTIVNEPQMRLSVVPMICVSVYVYGTTLNTGIIGGSSTGSSGSGGGGGGGGSTPPPNYNCPPAEWWCESGEYRFINGVLYTSVTYPGKESGFPWAWWETGNYLTANLPMVFLNVEMLGLSLTHAQYLINEPVLNQELSNYLLTDNGQTPEEKKSAATEHINGILTNPAYADFVENYEATDNSGKMWWDNEVWIELNIVADLEGCFPTPCDLKILNQAEKKFCKDNPVAMFFIAQNRQIALTITNEEYGLPINNTLIHPNNKSNAFIHALFCALNANNFFIGAEKAGVFADAHESDTPLQFLKEKTMDDYNNEVGINIGVTNSINNIISKVREAVSLGYLRYLSPLNMNDGCFWGCQGNLLGTHGIDGNTEMKQTNQ